MISPELTNLTGFMQQVKCLEVTSGGVPASGERSPVPREVAEAFRVLFEAPEAASGAQQPGQAAQAAQAAGAIDPGAPVESARSVQSPQGAQAPSGASDLAADAPQAPALSPAELLGVQFERNMEVFEARFMSTARSTLESAFEERLKSGEG